MGIFLIPAGSDLPSENDGLTLEEWVTAIVGVDSCWWEAELDIQDRLAAGELCLWGGTGGGLVVADLEVRVSSEVERRSTVFLVD